MDNTEYTRRVLARASHRWFPEKVDVYNLTEVADAIIAYGNKLDVIKKALLYGRGDDVAKNMGNHTNHNEQEQRIIHAILGVVTEGVELLEAWRDAATSDKSFDTTNLREEFGDVMWYLALGADAIGSSLSELMLVNDNKLQARFGSTFTTEAANNRDLVAERLVLEAGRADDDEVA